MKNIKNCILACTQKYTPGTVITSEEIIAMGRGFANYLIDQGIPASRSTNAMLGRQIRRVGETSGLLKFIGKTIVTVQNGKTTLARYQIL